MNQQKTYNLVNERIKGWGRERVVDYLESYKQKMGGKHYLALYSKYIQETRQFNILS